MSCCLSRQPDVLQLPLRVLATDWGRSSGAAFGCQKHVKGVVTSVHHIVVVVVAVSVVVAAVVVVVCGASFLRIGAGNNCKKLETIESNSFA